MPQVYADRVKETTSTAGTGALSLAGAPAGGFATFAAAVGVGNTTDICIIDAAAGAWEVCEATLSGSTTLERGTVLASSTGSRINFGAGQKDVFVCLPADKFMPRAEIEALANVRRHAFAASDEFTALTVGVSKITLRLTPATTLDQVRLSLTTASSSGAVEVDIKYNHPGDGWVSIFTTRPTIDANQRTSATAATPAVLNPARVAIPDDGEIRVDIIAQGTGASGLKVYLRGVAP